jgi:hypothetical protein
MLSPRFSSYTASYDLASNICQACRPQDCVLNPRDLSYRASYDVASNICPGLNYRYTLLVDRDQTPAMHAACLRLLRSILSVTVRQCTFRGLHSSTFWIEVSTFRVVNLTAYIELRSERM